jgi:hypothetical protein
MAERYVVKGTHVIMARKWVDERLGEGSFMARVGDAPTDWPKVILPGSWYNVFPLEHAIADAARQLKMSTEDAATDIAARNARADLTTVYRAFLRVAGPHLIMNATSALWRNYVAFAEAKKVKNDYGKFIGECHKLPPRLLDWACGCWRGFVPTAIELAGGKESKGRILEKGREGDANDMAWLRCEVTYR